MGIVQGWHIRNLGEVFAGAAACTDKQASTQLRKTRIYVLVRLSRRMGFLRQYKCGTVIPIGRQLLAEPGRGLRIASCPSANLTHSHARQKPSQLRPSHLFFKSGFACSVGVTSLYRIFRSTMIG